MRFNRSWTTRWWVVLSVGSDDENRGGSYGEVIESYPPGSHTREARPNLDFASFGIRIAYSSAAPVCRP
jgi:hypothetical protein